MVTPTGENARPDFSSPHLVFGSQHDIDQSEERDSDVEGKKLETERKTNMGAVGGKEKEGEISFGGTETEQLEFFSRAGNTEHISFGEQETEQPEFSFGGGNTEQISLSGQSHDCKSWVNLPQNLPLVVDEPQTDAVIEQQPEEGVEGNRLEETATAFLSVTRESKMLPLVATSTTTTATIGAQGDYLHPCVSQTCLTYADGAAIESRLPGTLQGFPQKCLSCNPYIKSNNSPSKCNEHSEVTSLPQSGYCVLSNRSVSRKCLSSQSGYHTFPRGVSHKYSPNFVYHKSGNINISHKCSSDQSQSGYCTNPNKSVSQKCSGYCQFSHESVTEKCSSSSPPPRTEFYTFPNERVTQKCSASESESHESPNKSVPRKCLPNETTVADKLPSVGITQHTQSGLTSQGNVEGKIISNCSCLSHSSPRLSPSKSCLHHSHDSPFHKCSLSPSHCSIQPKRWSNIETESDDEKISSVLSEYLSSLGTDEIFAGKMTVIPVNNKLNVAHKDKVSHTETLPDAQVTTHSQSCDEDLQKIVHEDYTIIPANNAQTDIISGYTQATSESESCVEDLPQVKHEDCTILPGNTKNAGSISGFMHLVTDSLPYDTDLHKKDAGIAVRTTQTENDPIYSQTAPDTNCCEGALNIKSNSRFKAPDFESIKLQQTSKSGSFVQARTMKSLYDAAGVGLISPAEELGRIKQDICQHRDRDLSPKEESGRLNEDMCHRDILPKEVLDYKDYKERLSERVLQNENVFESDSNKHCEKTCSHEDIHCEAYHHEDMHTDHDKDKLTKLTQDYEDKMVVSDYKEKCTDDVLFHKDICRNCNTEKSSESMMSPGYNVQQTEVMDEKMITSDYRENPMEEKLVHKLLHKENPTDDVLFHNDRNRESFTWGRVSDNRSISLMESSRSNSDSDSSKGGVDIYINELCYDSEYDEEVNQNFETPSPQTTSSHGQNMSSLTELDDLNQNSDTDKQTDNATSPRNCCLLRQNSEKYRSTSLLNKLYNELPPKTFTCPCISMLDGQNVMLRKRTPKLRQKPRPSSCSFLTNGSMEKQIHIGQKRFSLYSFDKVLPEFWDRESGGNESGSGGLSRTNSCNIGKTWEREKQTTFTQDKRE